MYVMLHHSYQTIDHDHARAYNITEITQWIQQKRMRVRSRLIEMTYLALVIYV